MPAHHNCMNSFHVYVIKSIFLENHALYYMMTYMATPTDKTPIEEPVLMIITIQSVFSHSSTQQEDGFKETETHWHL